MKKVLMYAVPVVLSLTSLASHAQDYYFCNVGGNDSNSGTSASSPFKSYDKAMSLFSKLNAGDQLLFCKGGQFIAASTYTLFNTKATADNPITIASYTPANASNSAAPQIVNTLGNAFYFNTRNTATADGGVIIKDLNISGDGKGYGVFLLNGFSNVTVDNVTISNFHAGMDIGGGALQSNNITLKDSTIINNWEQGFLGGANNLLIENNTFENNGFKGKNATYFYHNVYLSTPIHGSPNHNVIIKGNTLYKAAMRDGMCGGASLVAHGETNGLLIDSNTIKEDKGAAKQYCYGIGVGPAYSDAEKFTDVKITNNKLLNMGMIGIALGSIVGGEVKDNVIMDQGNLLAIGIKIPDSAPGVGDADSKDVTISGNQIYSNYQSPQGIIIGGVNPFVVTNNLVSFQSGANGKCVVRTDANALTDISTNKCQTHSDVGLVDSSTGQVVTSVDNVGSVVLGSTTTTDAPTTSSNTTTTSTVSRFGSSSSTTSTGSTSAGTTTTSGTGTDTSTGTTTVSRFGSTATTGTTSSGTTSTNVADTSTGTTSSSTTVSRFGSTATTGTNTSTATTISRFASSAPVTTSSTTTVSRFGSTATTGTTSSGTTTASVSGTSTGTTSSTATVSRFGSATTGTVSFNDVVNDVTVATTTTDATTCRAYSGDVCLFR